MKPQMGLTRSDIRARHALLTPESHEWITQPGWGDAQFAYLISPDMSAKFAMSLVRCDGPCATPCPEPGVARFLFCLEGGLTLEDGERVAPESFAFLPPNAAESIKIDAGSRFVMFEWRFLERGPVPGRITGNAADIQGQPLRGDDWLTVQKLLPTDTAFDAEFNLMSFQPGASLAYVETHFMEHGLLMLDGGGVYRLDDQWYPVGAGDAIWMGPHVPQWFGALGRKGARYLIYKNYNRSPLTQR